MGNEAGSMGGGSDRSSGGGSSNSFGATFAREHRAQGANGTFEWNGKSYSTARADGRDLRAEAAASRSARATSSHSNSSWSSSNNRQSSHISNSSSRSHVTDSSLASTLSSIKFKAIAEAIADSFSVFTITFKAEGSDDRSSRYYSRRVHLPPGASGVTIGRGYDMKEKSAYKIKSDLKSVGVSEANANKMATAAGYGKNGKSAQRWMSQNKEFVKNFELTPEQERNLFIKTYKNYRDTAKRICNKDDVQRAYGKTNWDGLNLAIKEVVIDLTYRGDSDGQTRRKYHKYVVQNDVRGLYNVMKDRNYWCGQRGVPQNRFQERIQRLELALQK